MFFLYFFVLIVSFYGLIKGSDLFVDGSCAVARKLNVPSLIIGLTIVAMGTSAPELAVSTSAAINGSNEIAMSNVVGSNIANLLLILGVTALVCPVPVNSVVLKRDFPVVIIAPIILLLVVGGRSLFAGHFLKLPLDEVAGRVSRMEAIILLVFFVAYILYLIYDAKKGTGNEQEEEAKDISGIKCALLILGGLAMIVMGGKGVVYSAKEIARAAGMTETLIGLTIVAIGTSLPELVTSIMAARKGEVELAVGNVLGSNIFNLLMVLGLSAAIHPITVNVASLYDLIVCIMVSILTCIFAITKRRIVAGEGAAMLAIYLLYIGYAQMR